MAPLLAGLLLVALGLAGLAAWRCELLLLLRGAVPLLLILAGIFAALVGLDSLRKKR